MTIGERAELALVRLLGNALEAIDASVSFLPAINEAYENPTVDTVRAEANQIIECIVSHRAALAAYREWTE